MLNVQDTAVLRAGDPGQTLASHDPAPLPGPKSKVRARFDLVEAPTHKGSLNNHLMNKYTLSIYCTKADVAPQNVMRCRTPSL